MKPTATLLLWMLAAGGALPALLFAQTGATVEGTVTNSLTHAPVAGVLVILTPVSGEKLSAGDEHTFSATTDDAGTYRITGMTPGVYSPLFERAGFVAAMPASFSQPLRVASTGTPIRFDASLTPLATVRGRVLEPAGQPAANATVVLGQRAGVGTDSAGQFVVRDVYPGSYVLLARPAPASSAPEKGERTEIIPTFFPSTADRNQSQNIVVHGGDDLAGFEVRLQTAPVFRVRGVVRDPAGNPAPRAQVNLLSHADGPLLGGVLVTGSATGGPVQFCLGGGKRRFREASVVSNEQGGFEFRSTRPGEWTLQANSLPERGSLPTQANASFTVSDRDLDNIEITFVPRFTIRATVEWSDPQPPPASREASVMLIAEDGGPWGSPQHAAPDGALRIENLLPGRYRIIPMPGNPSGYYASSVLLGTQEGLGQTVDLSPSSPPIRILMRSHTGAVRGAVEKGAGSQVLLWPQTPASPDLVRTVQCDASGAFEMSDVPPGSYFLLAFDRVNTQTASEAFLRTALTNAARVVVDDGATASVALAVIPWSD